MKNIVKNFGIIPAKIPNMHGHTKIELRDKAGAKKVIESDNTFQTAVLADYMRSLGRFDNSPWANDTWASQNVWRNLCGGLFLFDTTIQVGSKYMPAGVKMVGNGSYGVSNSGTPTELGSYNSTESSAGNSSIIQVYDFTTSQANGTIACACLTSETGGYIGYGNPSGGVASSLYAFSRNQSSRSTSSYYCIYDNINYGISKSDQTLTITKTPVAVTEASVFQGYAIETLTHELSNSYLGDYIHDDSSWSNIMDNGIVYLFPHNRDSSEYGRIESGGTINYIAYDIANNTVTESTLTNNTGTAIMFRAGQTIKVMNGSLYVPTAGSYYSSNSPYWMINLSTSAVEQEIETTDSTYDGKLTSDLLQIDGYVYDSVNDTLYRNNSSTSSAWAYNDADDSLESGGSSTMYKYKNPLYLATINNLDESVTKDSSMTMKVTYSLTTA